MKNYNFLLFILLFLSLFCFGQSKYVVTNKKGIDKINFKLINNVIVIPVEVNGVELSFVLDSGVNKPIIFNFLKKIRFFRDFKYRENIFKRFRS